MNEIHVQLCNPADNILTITSNKRTNTPVYLLAPLYCIRLSVSVQLVSYVNDMLALCFPQQRGVEECKICFLFG